MINETLLIDDGILHDTNLTSTEKLVLAYMKQHPDARMVDVASVIGKSFITIRRLFIKHGFQLRE